MPTALYDLTVSCRNITVDSNGDFVKCGTCNKCTWQKYIKDEIVKSTSNTAIATSLRADSIYTDDKRRIQADWAAHLE